MKLIWVIVYFLQYVILTELLCTLFITRLNGLPFAKNDDPTTTVYHYEDYAKCTPRGKLVKGEENGDASQSNDEWQAYTLEGSQWPKTALTYTVIAYSNQFSKEITDNVVAKALKKWADVSSLTFEAIPNTERADIEFEFVAYLTTDRVAASFYPGHKQSIKFRDDVHWSADSYGANNLLLITVHELGHAFGISHSNVESAIMYGTYLYPKGPNFSLDTDDILAIQRLYGPNPESPQKPLYDPGPSTDTPGNEPLWDDNLHSFIMYVRNGSKWILHRYDGSSWIPESSPLPRTIPEPPSARTRSSDEKQFWDKNSQSYRTKIWNGSEWILHRYDGSHWVPVSSQEQLQPIPESSSDKSSPDEPSSDKSSSEKTFTNNSTRDDDTNRYTMKIWNGSKWVSHHYNGSAWIPDSLEQQPEPVSQPPQDENLSKETLSEETPSEEKLIFRRPFYDFYSNSYYRPTWNGFQWILYRYNGSKWVPTNVSYREIPFTNEYYGRWGWRRGYGSNTGWGERYSRGGNWGYGWGRTPIRFY